MGIKVTDIAFVRFNAPDLDEMQRFGLEFGLVVAERTNDTLYMRGTNDEGFVHVTHLADEPGFAGFALNAETVDDLDVLAAIDGFSEVRDLEGPGGGRVVSTVDPVGYNVEVIAGRDSVGRLPAESHLHNDASIQMRNGATIRHEPGPSRVRRLGHVVLSVAELSDTIEWYKSNFGLITTDEVLKPSGEDVLGHFMRCDRGDKFVDHHSLFLIGSGKTAYNHSAFEVGDIDDVMSGHDHLLNAERTHAWGVGRHVLGSQLFDYWDDPWGHTVEHFADSDVFDNTTPKRVESFDVLVRSQWGPTTTKEHI